MFVDVATDLWGRKDNVRLFLKTAAISYDELAELISRVYTTEMRRTAPRAYRDEAMRMAFEIDFLRILRNSSSSWVSFTTTSQPEFAAGCQLYVFQTVNLYHSDEQSLIPVARLVNDNVTPSKFNRNVERVDSGTPRRLSAAFETGSPTLSRSTHAAPSARGSSLRGKGTAREQQQAVPSLPPSIPTELVEEVFYFLAVRKPLPSNGEWTSAALSRLKGESIVLSRLLKSVGVNLERWRDEAFSFLRDERTAFDYHPELSYFEFFEFASIYPSLVKLLQRFVTRHYRPGSSSQDESLSLERSAESPSRSPPRSSPSPSSPRQPGGYLSDAPNASSQRKDISPPRGSPMRTPTIRQQSVCCRLSQGLASIATAKDRKLRVYTPM